MRLFYSDLLVPAVHATDGIGMDGERQVLMHAAVAPPDARGIRIGAGEGADPLHLSQPPAAIFLLNVYHAGGPAAALILWSPPAAEMMRAGYNSRLDTLGYPHVVNKVADVRRHTQ